MSFTVTVIHAPDALSTGHWEMLRSRAPGAYSHELRLVLDDPGDGLSGAELDQLLRKALEAPDTQLSTEGVLLNTLQPGSALIHPAMVVLVSRNAHRICPARPTQLQLCLDSGPDAGRLIPLRRGRTQIGRGKLPVSAADPQMSRQEAVLEVGTSAVRLYRKTAAGNPLPLTTEDEFQLGSTRCRLSVDTPPLRAPQTWPPPEEPIGAKPPERRNRMMLAFALVPLLAGIILVLVTGMWFFLLFSGASAVIAVVMFFNGRRQRLKYRQLVRQATQRWRQHTHTALCSPGDLIEQLRSPGAQSIYAGARADQAPAVRLGIGTCTAQLDADEETGGNNDDAAEDSAVGIILDAGELTTISGPLRCAQRLIHWLTAQLALNPLRPQVVLIGTAPVPELRDLAQVERLSAEEFLTGLDAELYRAETPGVLLLAEPDRQHWAQQALSAGWHVIALGGDQQKAGWQVDLEQGWVERRGVVGNPVRQAADLRYEGLALETLREHLRLGLSHGASTSRDQVIPQICSHRLEQPMLTGSSAQHLFAVLGRHASGVQSLDLIEDGPHVLIAGTSGSGKSELLKTMLSSLCARYGPNELGMVLIDFKGGATFQQLSRLEHSLGLVTDLSQAAAERTLEGIRSELMRREKLFMAAEAGDYAEYRQMYPDRALSRILVVIDEFRIFSHQLPDQMDELMRLATLGRSLGLHLVLSTQRPQGVVTADIRANIGASICLRVSSEEESRDVIGSPVAAGISRSVPGRAAIRLPGESPQLFQTAQLSSTRSVSLRPEVMSSETPGPTGFRDCMAAIEQATSAEEHIRQHTPLLPPLPESLAASDRLSPGQGQISTLLLGRLDDPAGQRQQDLVLDLANPRSLLLLGEAGSGTAEASAAVTAQALATGAEADVYLLDGDRSLTALAGDSRVGSWLTDEDLPEVDHLLQRLCDELANRRVREPAHDGTGRPRPLLVVVSGYAQWHAAAYSGLQSLDHLLGTLAADGPQAGISVVICGGRELSIGKLAARVPTRIYCPLGTSDEVSYLWPKLRSAASVPGRGVLVDPHTPAPGMSVQLVTEKVQPVQSGAQSGSAPAISVRPLPELLTADQLPAVPDPSAECPTVGIRQFTGDPAVLPLGPVNLLLGGRGMGKTSCLRLLQQQIPDAALIRPGEALPSQFPPVLLVDDARACSAEQHSYIQQAVAQGVTIVAADAPSASVFSQLPWAHPARSEGTNIILSPTSRAHGDAFATLTPLMPRPIPGRAVHLRPEGPAVVQWAMPHESSRSAANY